ncbi:BnaC05g08040D [Brassica napus]|nr:unnamed protein product [Brassica napus]CDY37970.1 BnaC05g08040D [Brassica napus]
MKSKLNISFSKSLSRKRTDDSLCFWSVFFCNFCFSKSFSLQTVYKGRKKKTIEYFQGSSREILTWILTKFGISSLHSLNHPNVLKFNACYHLINYLPLSFIFLEYCVGGGGYLRTLLQQDCKLPEDSVYGLAYDLVIALLFLHSKQITYCDLKPSNILLDENGHIKLCDFGLARKLDDISKSPSIPRLNSGKRGTPYYMAPELYEDGGVLTYGATWLCFLYEYPTPPLPGNASRPFLNLIESLLIKDPAQRIQWADLCGHAFWKRRKFQKVVQSTRRTPLMVQGRHETPQKGTPVGSKAQTKFPSKTTGRPLPNSNENCAEVKIDNTDMELDFDEDNDEDGPDEPEGNENTSCAQDERVLSQNESHRRQGVRSNNVPDENSSANETPTSGEPRDFHEEQSEPFEVSAALPSASPQVKTHREREVSGITVHHDSSKTPNSLSAVL